jgi:hypothetical protein
VGIMIPDEVHHDSNVFCYKICSGGGSVMLQHLREVFIKYLGHAGAKPDSNGTLRKEIMKRINDPEPKARQDMETVNGHPHLKYFASLNAVDGTCALLQKLRGKLSKGGESALGTPPTNSCNGDLWYEACYWMDQKIQDLVSQVLMNNGLKPGDYKVHVDSSFLITKYRKTGSRMVPDLPYRHVTLGSICLIAIMAIVSLWVSCHWIPKVCFSTSLLNMKATLFPVVRMEAGTTSTNMAWTMKTKCSLFPMEGWSLHP